MSTLRRVFENLPGKMISIVLKIEMKKSTASTERATPIVEAKRFYNCQKRRKFLEASTMLDFTQTKPMHLIIIEKDRKSSHKKFSKKYVSSNPNVLCMGSNLTFTKAF